MDTDWLCILAVVFPAGAGVILGADFEEGMSEGFPRRCGGDPYLPYGNAKTTRFSPQVRG